MKYFAIAALAAVSVAAPAAAVVQLDQNGLVGLPSGGDSFIASSSAASGSNGWDLAQTFTAGKTGALAYIGLQTYNSGAPTTYTLTVFSGDVTSGTATALGSTSFTAQTQTAFLAGGVTSVDLTGLGIQMNSGTLYSYEVSSSHPTTATPPSTTGRLQWAIGTQDASGENLVLNDYAGGRAYRETFTNGVSNGWITDGNFSTDRGFSTFVDVAPVPEPGEWAMMGAGLAIVGGLAKRRRKA